MNCKRKPGENSTVAFAPSTFTLHIFTTELMDKKVVYQVIKMSESVFICINYTNGLHLDDLSLAMLNRYDNLPVGTQLIGDFIESASKNMATRVSKKLNKSVYVSCNLDCDRLTIPLVEKYLYEEIKKHPEKF